MTIYYWQIGVYIQVLINGDSIYITSLLQPK
jgi:hypothetical protein